MPKNFDFQKIEKKWHNLWLKNKIYEPDLTPQQTQGYKKANKPFYNLMMFPYPSAEGLHVGNMYAFTGSDIYGRFKRMSGYDVFEPIGLDGFGIHSENYALKIGAHPMKQAEVSEKHFYKQLRAIGNGFSWNEHLETYDPAYYKWTQWIFVQMFKRGLAYRRKQAVNWCPSCKTVLADEQVINGRCERCNSQVIKKDLEQWFFRITKYAEKLLRNLERIDWSERVKISQRNWIGRSEGALIKFKLKTKNPKLKTNYIEVFTTRPDTLFGATYLVLAPEHEIISNFKFQISNLKEIENYIKKAKNKSDEERITEGREKTGVELKGIFVVNPANKKTIPIFVADYVLSSYGTGAIMAVPAHDQRDFEFAKKFELPIVEVVVPEFGLKRENEERRDGGFGAVLDYQKQKYAVGKLDNGLFSLFGGGVEKGEDEKKGVLREIWEESGLRDFKEVLKIASAFTHYFNILKKKNRFAFSACYLVILNSGKTGVHNREAHEKFNLEWASADEIIENWEKHNEDKILDHWIFLFKKAVGTAIRLKYDKTSDPTKFNDGVFTGNGILINSGKFTEMDSEKAKWEITKSVAGKKQIQYRLRDWLISRQRYWGPPIPMIFCDNCRKAGKGERQEMPGWYSVAEKDLPVKLPFIKDFRPRGKGQSPLASVKSFYEVKCPKCGAKARRETDVSDTFLDSAWYYLRYPSTRSARSGQVPWEPELTKKWLPINMYIGGAEHSVLHLLYSRFLTMVFHDWKMVDFDEPFTVFRAHGLLIKEGAKMSKSKGNVINPDDYIKKFGADALRMYLMFLAPFEQGGDFRDAGILGIRRFLERVWRLGHNTAYAKEGWKQREIMLHRSIMKITSDIETLSFNTAISQLMILLKVLETFPDKNSLEIFLKLLAPFAPHLTEELWQMLGRKNSIHQEAWPKYDPKFIKEDEFELIIQINGRLRDKVFIEMGVSQKEAEEMALSRLKIKNFMAGQKIKKIIFVPNRLINFVVG